MQLILKNNIERSKLLALINFLKSMNFDFEMRSNKIEPQAANNKFNLAAGLWGDADITAENLRTKAWKRK